MRRPRCVLALGAAVLALGVVPAGAAAQSDQSAGNSASSTATNDSSTTQAAYQSQSSSSECSYGCGGSGQFQALSQDASTEQDASSDAAANQEAINANVPVTIGYGNESGDSSASQDLDNSASSEASNEASTTQLAGQEQSSDSSCHAGCGGSGQAQVLEQDANTEQKAESGAEANQRAINANVPVVIGYGNKSGSSSADQTLSNDADSTATNQAATEQKAAQEQSSTSDCKYGCGGSGQAQKLSQNAETKQYADSWAEANQDAINANVPVVIGWHNETGDSSATQELDNSATSDASNDATTKQKAVQLQEAESDGKAGSGGAGQFQGLWQDSSTKQKADSWAEANQAAENVNSPVTVSKGKKKKGKGSKKSYR
jgi:hypothetical protein